MAGQFEVYQTVKLFPHLFVLFGVVLNLLKVNDFYEIGSCIGLRCAHINIVQHVLFITQVDTAVERPN
jgi:hypothetical protein